MIDYKKSSESAERYIEKNLVACCRELIEWSDTGVLVGSHVRMVATFYSYADHAALALAEAAIKRIAMQKIVENSI